VAPLVCLPLGAPGRWFPRLRAWLALLWTARLPEFDRDGEAADMSDVAIAIVDRARRGEVRAFGPIVDHYDRRLRALAYRLVGDRDLMDDVLQEVYVKAFRALPGFKGDASIGTWLFRITYNTCLDQLRRDRNVVPLFGDPGQYDRPSPALGPDDTAVARHDLAAALATLKPDQRAAVLLVDAFGYDYSEAGSVLGVPAGTVASRLNRARAALRLVLKVADG
jgi:RNA polymerase sigma-70 factor (ECF subfamily)